MKKISKTKIEKRLRKKTNPILVEALVKLKKENPEVAKILSTSRKDWISLNLEELNEKVKENESVLIPGKLLSSGNLDKKVRIVAWDASEKSLEKIKGKSDFKTISEEMKKNPKLNGLRVIR